MSCFVRARVSNKKDTKTIAKALVSMDIIPSDHPIQWACVVQWYVCQPSNFFKFLRSEEELEVMLGQESTGGNIFLLGIVDSNWAKPTTGQEFRDKLRCDSLRKLHYSVKTFDDKHDGKNLINHCRSNFCDARRMKQAMDLKWGRNYVYSFDHVVLDYFFSPVSPCSISLIYNS